MLALAQSRMQRAFSSVMRAAPKVMRAVPKVWLLRAVKKRSDT